MNSKNDSKLTVINDHTENKNKSKLGKQVEQEQNHRDGDHMEGYQQGNGRGREGRKVQSCLLYTSDAADDIGQV